MSHIPAIIAEEQRKKREQEEEEKMTGYTPQDLNEEWEFKILRSSSNAFRNPRVLQQALHEESIAGWQLVEKLDNGRLRLKRAATAKNRDSMLPAGYNPYRIQYGTNVNMIMVGIGLLLAVGMGFFALFLTMSGSNLLESLNLDTVPWMAISVGAGVIILLGVALLTARNR